MLDLIQPHTAANMLLAQTEIEQSLQQKTLLMERVQYIRSSIKGMEDLVAWWRQSSVLQPNDCSRYHRLMESIAAGKVQSCTSTTPLQMRHVTEDRLLTPAETQTVLTGQSAPFVVTNDWATALGDSIEQDDQYALPYDQCVFEFRITGRTVIVMIVDNKSVQRVDNQIVQLENNQPIKRLAFVEHPGTDDWTVLNETDNALVHHIKFAMDQIRAVCIVLEAEVAATTLVQQPAKLNAKRAKTGKLPLCDYRVVRLNRDPKAKYDASGTGESGRRVRMHFRRGHWRHYPDDKRIWIKWQLVGNPDLGFINKHYSI